MLDSARLFRSSARLRIGRLSRWRCGQFLAPSLTSGCATTWGTILCRSSTWRSKHGWYGCQPVRFPQTCGAALAMEHTGDLYSCDHFVYPENKLGNITDSHWRKWSTRRSRRSLARTSWTRCRGCCRECSVRFACNGECPKHRFLKTPDGEPGLNYLCAGYKHFFNHIDPYMRFMAAELAGRAPGQRDAVLRHRKNRSICTGRPNDPCPCGSGKKFKHCCGQ